VFRIASAATPSGRAGSSARRKPGPKLASPDGPPLTGMPSTMKTSTASPVRAGLTRALEDAATRASLIGTQLLGLALCRYVVRLEPLASLPIDEVVVPVARTVQRYLTDALTDG
jgi:Tetracyclin repressor-like, C-terminal domain